MRAISLQVRVRCATCARLLPVNGLVPALGCEQCGGTTVIDWRSVWESIARGTSKEGVSFLCERSVPACSVCATDLAMKASMLDGGRYPCRGCGRWIRVRVLPRAEPALALDHERMRLATHAVGEDEALLAARSGRAAIRWRTESAVVECRACGEAVAVQGSRVLHCAVCSAKDVLPSDKWRAPLVARTWHVWFSTA
jgi:Zn finger protein HypA/HybF involved in hydrogenase expression